MDKDTNKASKPMPEGYYTIARSMVLDGMKFETAGTQIMPTGKPLYSPKYIKTKGHQIKQDVRFCKERERLRAENERKTEDRREKRLRDLDNIIEDPNTNQRDRIRAIEVQGKMCGWMSERIIHETPDRQRQLDEKEREEAARLLAIRFDTTKRIDSKVIDDG